MVVGSNSDPQQQQQQQQQQQPSSFVLSQGAEVEVSSDEEGFRGAWYNATILECSPQPPNKSGSSKKRKREVCVQYKTLLADDGITPLTEEVDPIFIRPLPPDQVDENVFGERVFQVNDAVDASYRDGWWAGTVIKVLQDNQYGVYFDNPPDVIDFDGRDLRFHFDWVDGCWVRPPKKQPQETTGSMFSSGTAVEVILDREGVQNGWVPALVIKENGDDTYLVKYQISSNTDEGGMVRTVVNSDCIRPAPPRCSKSSYELLEKVDTLCDFQWRAGVVTKVLEGGKYNVFLKPGNVDMEVDLSKIRHHVDWVDGKWVNLSKEIVVLSDNEECLVDEHSCTNNLEASIQTETSGAVEVNAKLNVGQQSTQSTEQLPPCTFHLKRRKIKLGAPSGGGLYSRPLSELTGDTAEDPLSGTALESKRMPIEMSTREPPQRLSSQKMAKQQKVVELDFQKVAVVTRERRPTKSPFRIQQAMAAVKMNALNTAARNINGSVADSKETEGPLILGSEANGRRNSRSDYHSRLPEEERLKLLRNLNKDINGSAGNKKMLPNQQTSGGSTQRRKRGRPRKLVNLSSMSSKAGLEDHGTVDVPIKMAASARTANELELRTQTTVHPADSITGEVDVVITGVSNNVDDDQPLSTWFGGMHNAAVDELRSYSGKSANGSTERGEPQGDMTVESSAVDANTNALPDHQCLPFVKKSPVWETIESMGVFKLIPQRPHFNPLAKCKEEYREGSAIGIMVTFAGLFEKISSLQIDDCRSTLESTLETLLDLESHGFDVTAPRGRVNELMSIKDGQVELLNESNDITRQLKEHADERSKLSEKIKDIEKKIAALQEELDASKSKMEAEELHITRLQSHADAVKRQLESSRADFGKIATGPWKLP